MNFSDDLNKNLPKNGVSLHRRWGLRKNIDWGLHASLDSSGADIKYNYINLDRFASALGLKILAPFLSIDEFETYQIAIASYHSLDLLEICRPTLRHISLRNL